MRTSGHRRRRLPWRYDASAAHCHAPHVPRAPAERRHSCHHAPLSALRGARLETSVRYSPRRAVAKRSPGRAASSSVTVPAPPSSSAARSAPCAGSRRERQQLAAGQRLGQGVDEERRRMAHHAARERDRGRLAEAARARSRPQVLGVLARRPSRRARARARRPRQRSRAGGRRATCAPGAAPRPVTRSITPATSAPRRRRPRAPGSVLAGSMPSSLRTAASRVARVRSIVK